MVTNLMKLSLFVALFIVLLPFQNSLLLILKIVQQQPIILENPTTGTQYKKDFSTLIGELSQNHSFYTTRIQHQMDLSIIEKFFIYYKRYIKTKVVITLPEPPRCHLNGVVDLNCYLTNEQRRQIYLFNQTGEVMILMYGCKSINGFDSLKGICFPGNDLSPLHNFFLTTFQENKNDSKGIEQEIDKIEVQNDELILNSFQIDWKELEILCVNLIEMLKVNYDQIVVNLGKFLYYFIQLCCIRFLSWKFSKVFLSLIFLNFFNNYYIDFTIILGTIFALYSNNTNMKQFYLYKNQDDYKEVIDLMKDYSRYENLLSQHGSLLSELNFQESDLDRKKFIIFALVQTFLSLDNNVVESGFCGENFMFGYINFLKPIFIPPSLHVRNGVFDLYGWVISKEIKDYHVDFIPEYHSYKFNRNGRLISRNVKKYPNFGMSHQKKVSVNNKIFYD